MGQCYIVSNHRQLNTVASIKLGGGICGLIRFPSSLGCDFVDVSSLSETLDESFVGW